MRKKIFKIIGFTLLSIVALIIILVITAIISPHGRVALPVAHKEVYEPTKIASFPSMLHASGNQLLDENGEQVILHGLMPSDPARLDDKNQFTQKFFSKIHDTGANSIRVAVHPERWENDQDYLWRHLDPIVTWAGEMGMYVIIDWHMIGNINGAGDEMPDIKEEPKALTLEFWQLVSAYFKDAPNVIFEIWNEPAGGITSDEWSEYATELVQLIRTRGAPQLILVGGVEYSRDLSWVSTQPIADDNIAYVSHIYPGHSRQLWDHWFGDVSATYPVVMTEWGYMNYSSEDAPSYLRGTRAGYGQPLLEYLKSHQIGWIACWYDDEWKPPMFERGWKTTTDFGAFVLEQLQQVP